jgi:hypothetical protein
MWVAIDLFWLKLLVGTANAAAEPVGLPLKPLKSYS